MTLLSLIYGSYLFVNTFQTVSPDLRQEFKVPNKINCSQTLNLQHKISLKWLNFESGDQPYNVYFQELSFTLEKWPK